MGNRTQIVDEPRRRFVDDAAKAGLKTGPSAMTAERAWEAAHPEGRATLAGEHHLALWNFGVGDATPRPEHRAALSHFVHARLWLVGAGAELHVIGRAGASDSESVSLLALHRAEQVALGIGIRHRIPMPQIRWTAAGEPEPTSHDASGEAMAWSRRVDVTLHIPPRPARTESPAATAQQADKNGDDRRPPGIAELMPFERNDRLAWAFRRGLRGRWFSARDVATLTTSLESVQAKVDFTTGVMKGGSSGVQATIDAASQEIGNLINWAMEFYSTVYDPVLTREIVKVWTEAATRKARIRALLDLADVYQVRHPAGSTALANIAEAIVVLEAVAEWLTTQDAMFELLMALSPFLGELLGDLRDRIMSLTGDPEKLGVLVGDVAGRVATEVALNLLGIPL